MPDTRFDRFLLLLGVAFVATLAVVVMPPLLDGGFDVSAAVRDGFVNPYSSGFAIDTLFTYGILVVWVVYEATYRGVRHGWIAVVLGLVGVALALVTYLLIRHKEIGPQTWR